MCQNSWFSRLIPNLMALLILSGKSDDILDPINIVLHQQVGNTIRLMLLKWVSKLLMPRSFSFGSSCTPPWIIDYSLSLRSPCLILFPIAAYKNSHPLNHKYRIKLFYSIRFVSQSTCRHLKPHNCISGTFFIPLVASLQRELRIMGRNSYWRFYSDRGYHSHTTASCPWLKPGEASFCGIIHPK